MHWPYYIKTTANFPNIPPATLIQYFQWIKFATTQAAIDPFFDQAELIHEPKKDIQIIRKSTKSLFLFPRREMIQVLMKSKISHDKSVAIVTNPKYSPFRNISNDGIKLSKGSSVHVMLSVNLSSEYKNKIPTRKDAKFVRSYQDMIGWFLEDGRGGSNLIIVMQVDLGRDIPRYVCVPYYHFPT